MRKHIPHVLTVFSWVVGLVFAEKAEDGDYDKERCKQQAYCSQHGVCIAGRCHCWLGWDSKDDCSLQWREVYKGWGDVFMGYRIATCVAFGCLGCWIVYQLFLIFRDSKHKFGVITQALLLMLFMSVLRVVYFGVDPHRINQIFNTETDIILFQTPVVLSLMTFCLMLVFWAELSIKTGVEELQHQKYYRSVFWVLFVVSTLTIFPMASLLVVYPDTPWSTSLYLGTVILWLIFLAIAGFIYGLRLRRTILLIFVPAHHSVIQNYVNQLVICLYIFIALTVLFFANAVVFALLNAYQHAWKWLSLEMIFRLLEFLYNANLLVLLTRRTLKQDTSPRETERSHLVPTKSRLN